MVEPQIVVLVVAGSSPVGHPAYEVPNPKAQTPNNHLYLNPGFWDFKLVPVAQPDRASDFGSEGWGFESLQARHIPRLMNLSRRDLDTNVVNIELTLASIIQGVALYFLTESARTALSLNN